MREFKTIETDRYEKLEGNLVKHVGMIKAQEAFDLLYDHLKQVDLLPDEYFLSSTFEDMNRELPDFHTAICYPNWGSNEGIYIDIMLQYTEDRERKYFHFATGKTLDESGDAFLKMARIAAECSMMLNGRGSIVRVSENAYENTNTQEQENTSLSARIESAAARSTDSLTSPHGRETAPEL